MGLKLKNTYQITILLIAFLFGSLCTFAQAVDASLYCTSIPTNSTFYRFNKINFKGINYNNTSTCQTYQNKTGSIISLYADEIVSGTIRLGSCSSPDPANTRFAVFIDWNADRDEPAVHCVGVGADPAILAQGRVP